MLEEMNDAKVSAYMNDREKADFGSGIKTALKPHPIQ